MGVLKDLFKDYRFAVGFILICFLSFLAVASFFLLMTPLSGYRFHAIKLRLGPIYWEPILRARMFFGRQLLPYAIRL